MLAHSIDTDAPENLPFGLAKFAMLADAVADIAVEIIETGRRCDFNISNLDSYLSSPYLVPNISIEDIDQ